MRNPNPENTSNILVRCQAATTKKRERTCQPVPYGRESPCALHAPACSRADRLGRGGAHEAMRAGRRGSGPGTAPPLSSRRRSTGAPRAQPELYTAFGGVARTPCEAAVTVGTFFLFVKPRATPHQIAGSGEMRKSYILSTQHVACARAHPRGSAEDRVLSMQVSRERNEGPGTPQKPQAPIDAT